MSKKKKIEEEIKIAGKITAVRNTKASGEQIARGVVYNVPGDINLKDALTLVLIGKAEVGNTSAKIKKAAPPKELKDHTVPQLKELAEKAEVEGFAQMNKSELIAALEE